MTGADVRMSPSVFRIKPAERHLYRGQWLTAKEIAEMTGIDRNVVYARIRRGQPVDEARRRTPRLYWYQGQQMTAKQVAKVAGLCVSAVYTRVSGDRILDTDELREQRERYADPHPLAVMLTYSGKTQNMTAWSAELGISVSTLHARLTLGWTVKRALTEAVRPRTPNIQRRNRRLIARIVGRIRTARNRILIQRITNTFRLHAPGYLQTFTNSQRTGADRRAVERGHYDVSLSTENQRATA